MRLEVVDISLGRMRVKLCSDKVGKVDDKSDAGGVVVQAVKWKTETYHRKVAAATASRRIDGTRPEERERARHVTAYLRCC